MVLWFATQLCHQGSSMLLYFNSTSRWGGFSFLELLFHGHRTAAAAPGITSACIVAQGGKVRRATKAFLLL